MICFLSFLFYNIYVTIQSPISMLLFVLLQMRHFVAFDLPLQKHKQVSIFEET